MLFFSCFLADIVSISEYQINKIGECPSVGGANKNMEKKRPVTI